VHSSYEALLADPSIDAVYIPLPNHMHVEWTLKALQAGKHVLTEKPIALRAGEIDQIIAERDRTGLLAAEAYMIVHHPQWQRAKEWLEAGEIGTLRHVDAAFSFHLTDMENIRNRPDTGGGSLRDIGVYTFGSARFVTGAEAEAVDRGADAAKTASTPSRWSSARDGRERPALHLSLDDLDAALQPAGGDVPGRQGHDPAGGRAVQRQRQRPGRGRTACAGQPRDHRPLPHRQPLQSAGRGLRAQRSATGRPIPARWNSCSGTQRMMDMAYDRAVDIQP
jgi:hypothetical protein